MPPVYVIWNVISSHLTPSHLTPSQALAEGVCGCFAPASLLLAGEPLPPQLLQGGGEGSTSEHAGGDLAGVLLQLPTEPRAWAHYESTDAAIDAAAAAATPAPMDSSSSAAVDASVAPASAISVIGCKVVDGTAYYHVQWVDKRQRQYLVWRRYSKFGALRSELSEHQVRTVAGRQGVL
jgi:hypothetical protein